MLISIEERKTIYYCNLSASILSSLGCLFITIMYCRYKILRSFAYKLVLVLSVLDLFNSIGYMIPTYDSGTSDITCQVQSIIINFFTFASVSWTTCIALCLYFIIVRSKLYIENYFTHYLLLILFISTVNTAIPLLTHTYGTVAGWCWISQNDGKADKWFYERYFLFFIPVFILIFTNVSLYIAVHRRLTVSENDPSRSSLNKKLKWYPLILSACFFPYLIKGTLELFNMYFISKYDFQITIPIGIVRSLNGFFNACAYGITTKVRSIISSKARKSIPISEYLSEDLSTSRDSGNKATRKTILTRKDIISRQCSLNSEGI